jgi:ABC-type lipoprotein release transport system permease subunit
MNSEIVVGSLSLVGTLLGSGLGVLASAKLTNYRIAQLEKKVDEHNGYGKKIPVILSRLDDIDGKGTEINI